MRILAGWTALQVRPRKPGEKVAMVKGPLANTIYMINAVTPGRRVWVQMDIMGGQTRGAVQADQLRAVSRCDRLSPGQPISKLPNVFADRGVQDQEVPREIPAHAVAKS